MSILAADFLAVAQSLLDADGEPNLRSAVSRSYYGALHEAITTANELNLPHVDKPNSGTHQLLTLRLKNANGKTLTKLAARLLTAKLVRCQADYDLKDDISRQEAALNVKKCHDLISDLQRMRNAARVSV